jgi:hypothetical protein
MHAFTSVIMSIPQSKVTLPLTQTTEPRVHNTLRWQEDIKSFYLRLSLTSTYHYCKCFKYLKLNLIKMTQIF